MSHMLAYIDELPTADPDISGALWEDGTTIKISDGPPPPAPPPAEGASFILSATGGCQAGSARKLYQESFWLSEPLIPYMTDFAVEAWVKFEDYAGSSHTLLSTGYHSTAASGVPGFDIKVDAENDDVIVATEDVYGDIGGGLNDHKSSETHNGSAGFFNDEDWHHLLILVYHDMTIHTGHVKSIVYGDGSLWDTQTHSAHALYPITWASDKFGGHSADTPVYGCGIGTDWEGESADFSGMLGGLRYWEYTVTTGGFDDIRTLMDSDTATWLYNDGSGRNLTDVENYSTDTRLWTDLIHAWECTDSGSDSLLDFRGENHGTLKNGAGTVPSVTGLEILKATAPVHNETVMRWEAISGDEVFEWDTSDGDSAPTLVGESAHGLSSLYFNGNQYLSTSATSATSGIHCVVSLENTTFDKSRCFVSFSDKSETDRFMYFGLNGEGKVEARSVDGASDNTLVGTTILNGIGLYHLSVYDDAIYIDGEDDSAAGSVVMPADFTADQIDTVTIGALITNNGSTISGQLRECCLSEIHSYSGSMDVSATYEDTSGTYGKSYWVKQYSELDATIDDIGSVVANLYVTGECNLDSETNQTTDANTCVRIVNAGKIITGDTYGNAKTFTVNGHLWSDKDDCIGCGSQFDGVPDIFEGGEKVVLANTRFDRIPIEWFDKARYTEKCHMAMRCANASSVKNIYVENGFDFDDQGGEPIFAVEQNFNDIRVYGRGRGLVTFRYIEASAGLSVIEFQATASGCLFENFTVDGNNISTGAGGGRVALGIVAGSPEGPHTFNRIKGMSYKPNMFLVECNKGCIVKNSAGYFPQNAEQQTYIPNGAGHVNINLVSYDPLEYMNQHWDMTRYPYNGGSLYAERCVAWGGGSSTIKVGADSDVTMTYNVEFRNTLIEQGNNPIFQSTSPVNFDCDLHLRVYNVFASNPLTSFDGDMNTIVGSNIYMSGLTLDMENNRSRQGTLIGLPITEENIAYTGINVHVLNSEWYGLYAGSSSSSYYFKDLYLHNCGTGNSHYPFYIASDCDIYVTGGVIEGVAAWELGNGAKVDLVRFHAAGSSGEFHSVIFGGTDDNEDGLYANTNTTIVGWGCTTGDIDDRVTDGAGTINLYDSLDT